MGGGSEASDGKYGGKKKVEEKVKNQKVTEVSNTAGLMVRYVQITEGRDGIMWNIWVKVDYLVIHGI